MLSKTLVQCTKLQTLKYVKVKKSKDAEIPRNKCIL